jgi:N-acetylneuraminic acid mutarotase
MRFHGTIASILILPIVISLAGCGSGNSTSTPIPVNEWTWESGSNTANATGVYGTLGVAATNNVPGARDSAVSWTDGNGNFWLFGGEQESGGTPDFNDLWEFNPTTNEWAWISGSNTTGSTGVFGTKGVASSANVPPANGFGAVGWVDRSNNLWLFGGYGDNGNRNDLWEFNPSNKEWIWVSGSSTAEAVGAYGTLGVASPSNVPVARGSAVSWIDSSGKLWLFGGFDDEYSTGTYGWLNDLWEFDPATNEWTWVSGKSTTNATGVYGTLGVAAVGNVPGARDSAVGWTDSSGNFWLFGGYGVDSTFTQGNLNDLWEFSPTTKEWTWVSGANTVGSNRGASGVYGSVGVAAAGNVPGGRYSAVSWIDSSGKLWLFGGYGVDSTVTAGNLNDLWEFNPATKEWTWVSGANSVGSTGVAPGVYGTLGVAATSNIPGGRSGASSWIDSSGNLWLFGGNGYDSTGTGRELNDLWKYQP